MPVFASLNSLARCALAAAVVLAVLAGCDGRPRRVPVSGKVLIDGQPLNRGFITVMPADGRAAIGEIQSDGSFRLTTFDEFDGCLPGTHPVAIESKEHLSPTQTRWLTPQDYAESATSGLSVTIDEPTDNLEIDLTWAGGQPFIEDTGGAGDIDPRTSQPETATEPQPAGDAD
jgi:hypothetical protein